jgi:hypothetical protein
MLMVRSYRGESSGAGLVLAAGRRLVDAKPDRPGVGALGSANGDLETQAQTTGTGAFRSGQPGWIQPVVATP